MADASGPSFGAFQDTMDQITRVLPTAAVTGFHFIAAQISPDSSCNESQRIAFAVFTAIFSILCAILAVVDRQQAPRRIAAAAQSAAHPPGKSPRKTKTPKEDPASVQTASLGRSRTARRSPASGRQLQSASPARARQGRGGRRSAVQSASPMRARLAQAGWARGQALASWAATWARSSTLQSALRAVGSALTFAAFAILTPPGPTCLFGAEGLPQWLTSSICVTTVVLFSSLTKIPGFAPTVQTT